MPTATIAPVDVAAQWPKLTQALSFDLFEATADVATAGAIVGDGAGAGLSLVAAGAAANPEVDLAAIIIGIALLIVAFAVAILLLRPIGWLLGHIPLVGGAIENALDNASNAVWNFVKSFVGNALHGIWSLLKMLWACTLGFPMAVGKALAALAGALHSVVFNLIPQVQNYLTGQDIINDSRARAREQQVQNQDASYTRALQAQAMQRADAQFQQAVNLARALSQQEAAYAQSLHADAVGHTNTLFQEAQGELRAEVQARINDVVRARAQAQADTAHASGAAHAELAAAVATLTTLVAGTATVLNTTLTNEIGQTAQTLTGDINQVEQKLDNYLDKCGIPMCDNLSNLSNSIPQMLGLFDDVAIAELIYDCIHNPQAVVDDIKAFVVAPMQEAAHLVGVA